MKCLFSPMYPSPSLPVPRVVLWHHVCCFSYLYLSEKIMTGVITEKTNEWSKYLQQGEDWGVWTSHISSLLFSSQPVSSHSQTNCLRSSDNQPLTNTNNSGNTSSQLSSHISDHFVKLYKNIICFTSKYFAKLIFKCWSLADSQQGQNRRFALIYPFGKLQSF